MIFSSIHTKDDFKNYPAAVQRAIEYLKNNDFTKMETGVYEIEGKLMYAQVEMFTQFVNLLWEDNFFYTRFVLK